MKQPNYSKIFIQIGYFIAVAYFLFLTYSAVKQNYQTTQKVASLKTEISVLNAEEGYIKDLNVYYATNTYKELEARRKLGMKKPDEKVIRIAIDPTRLAQIENREVITKANAADTKAANQETMSNPKKWFHYILRI